MTQNELVEAGALAICADEQDPFNGGDGLKCNYSCVACRNKFRAALQAIEASGKWRVVPVAPTEEMTKPGTPPYRFHPSEMRELWEAFLAAAPKVTP